jgi:hypothetical protein
MMTHEASVIGWFKITLAWVGVWISAVNFTAFLTAVALMFTIIFTGLQIYKIWHDIKRQKKLDAFAEKLKEPNV